MSHQLIVTYNIPDDAPDWFFQCAKDGDWNGMLEYVISRNADAIKFT